MLNAFRYPRLLSMHSEGTTKAMWSDAGTMHVLCHEEELAARNFAVLPTFIYR